MNDNKKQYTEQEIKDEIEIINAMEHHSMCSLWRHASVGHPYFNKSLPFADVFKKRLFDEPGGFTPEISKSL